MYRDNNKEEGCLLIKVSEENKIIVNVKDNTIPIKANITTLQSQNNIITNQLKDIIDIRVSNNQLEVEARELDTEIILSSRVLNNNTINVSEINSDLLLKVDKLNPIINIDIPNYNIIVAATLLNKVIDLSCGLICSWVKNDFEIFVVLEGDFIVKDNETYYVKK